MKIKNISPENPIIAWWSGGITSAVTCKLCVEWFGVENVRIIYIDTKNEDKDTLRFKYECENWYGANIETITSDYNSIEEVWYKFKSLNVATGAICSTELKRLVREKFQKTNKFSYQAFGFEIEEIKRAKALKINHPDCRPFFPLINELLSKKECINIVIEANSLFVNISIPITYKLGFKNANCFKTGCVQGGIGYWQKMRDEQPPKFDKMAIVEHELSDLKGEPVTMLKDKYGLIFLKHNPKFPHIRDLSCKKKTEVKPLIDCNGFCGTNDLIKKNLTETEINYQET